MWHRSSCARSLLSEGIYYEKRAKHFQHIVFPIIDTQQEANYPVFKEYLDGLKLGNLAGKLSFNTKVPTLANAYSMYAPGHKKSETTAKDAPKTRVVVSFNFTK